MTDQNQVEINICAKAEHSFTIDIRKQHKSRDEYEFNEDEDSWILNKNITVNVSKVRDFLDEKSKFGFTKTIIHYAKTLSASHTKTIVARVSSMLDTVGAGPINPTMLINYRSTLNSDNEWYLATIRGFLYKWHDFGYPGVSVEVIELLKSWTIKSNIKGDAVKRQDPFEGPFTDNELLAFNEGAARAFEQNKISITELSLALLMSNTGRRPIQISHMRICDLDDSQKNNKGEPLYVINIPRAKQRDNRFRESFTEFAISHELWVVLNAQRKSCIESVEDMLGYALQTYDKQNLPLFPDLVVFDMCKNIEQLRTFLETDKLHIQAREITLTLRDVARSSACISERTGELLHVKSTRFRYTTGTRAAREGWGEMVIAKLLDHTDTQNAGVYIKNIPEHVEALDDAMGHQLAKYAHAFQGVLVDDEMYAKRGEDITSRIQYKGKGTATCGAFGACGANVPVCCYTCSQFQPWLNGPHETIYIELIEERQRVLEITGDEVMAGANDRTIIAVAEVIQRCKVRRTELDQKAGKE